jgi:hypothetical protein
MSALQLDGQVLLRCGVGRQARGDVFHSDVAIEAKRLIDPRTPLVLSSPGEFLMRKGTDENRRQVARALPTGPLLTRRHCTEGGHPHIGIGQKRAQCGRSGRLNAANSSGNCV